MRDMSLGQPDDTYAVVLVGTGVPGACEMNTDYLVSLAEYFFKEWGVRTHTVATSNADMTVMDAVARAGGTGAALGLSGWDNSEEGRALLATLVGGTRQPAACTVALANLKNIDPQQATVRYLGEGIEETLERVRSPEACGIDTDGWAFDDETSPTSVELCPHTCERATQDTSSEIRVELGCLGAPVPVLQRTTVRETYEGDCPRTSQQPQWGFVSYSASTPSDSGITLEVRAAPNLDGLEQVPWLPLGHVSAAEENEECYFADGCYLDLWDAVGGVPTVHHPYLEVRITLDPSADNQTPVLDSWEVTYSCPDGE
jgi:hypothetical protein